MIKRSAILLLGIIIISLSLLVFTAYSATRLAPREKQVKCSGSSDKNTRSPFPWNIIAPPMF